MGFFSDIFGGGQPTSVNAGKAPRMGQDGKLVYSGQPGYETAMKPGDNPIHGGTPHRGPDGGVVYPGDPTYDASKPTNHPDRSIPASQVSEGDDWFGSDDDPDAKNEDDGGYLPGESPVRDALPFTVSLIDDAKKGVNAVKTAVKSYSNFRQFYNKHQAVILTGIGGAVSYYIYRKGK